MTPPTWITKSLARFSSCGEQRGVWPKLYDVLEVWKERASNVTGKEMPTGHFIAEEKPDMLLEELNKFLG